MTWLMPTIRRWPEGPVRCPKCAAAMVLETSQLTTPPKARALEWWHLTCTACPEQAYRLGSPAHRRAILAEYQDHGTNADP